MEVAIVILSLVVEVKEPHPLLAVHVVGDLEEGVGIEGLNVCTRKKRKYMNIVLSPC